MGSKKNELDSKTRLEVLDEIDRLGLLKHMDALIEETSRNDNHRHNMSDPKIPIYLEYFFKNQGYSEGGIGKHSLQSNNELNEYHILENNDQRKFYRQLRTSLEHKSLLCKVCTGKNRMNSSFHIDPFFLGVWYLHGDNKSLKIISNPSDIRSVKDYYDHINSSSKEAPPIKYQIRKFSGKLYSIEVIEGDIIDTKLKNYGLFEKRKIPPEYVNNPIYRAAVLGGFLADDHNKFKIFKCDGEILNLLLAMKLNFYFDDKYGDICIIEDDIFFSQYRYYKDISHLKPKNNNRTSKS